MIAHEGAALFRSVGVGAGKGRCHLRSCRTGSRKPPATQDRMCRIDRGGAAHHGAAMTRVTDLPADLQARLGGADLVVFDGVCVLCSGFFRFMLRQDRQARFRFATAQSEIGQALYAALDLPREDFETNLVIVEGRIHQRLDAFAAAMRALGGLLGPLSWLALLPAGVKDRAYHAIARNRYRLFGRRATCLLPDAALRGRFLPGGW